MVKISNIVILITPHHKKSIEHLFPELFYNSETLLFHSKLLQVEEFTCKKYELRDYGFSRRQIFTSPLKFIGPFRSNVQKINKEIKDLKSAYAFNNDMEWYFGSDKDIFTQILLNKLKGKLKKVIAVDEGLGFYVRLNQKDVFIKYLYRFITLLLFGQQLNYVKRLGTLPPIDTVYIRHKNLLPKKVKAIKYVEFELKSKQKPRNVEKSSILFFSYPEQDFMLDPNAKVERYVRLADYLERHDRKLVIKPHPRENIEFLKKSLENHTSITILEANMMGEELDYFGYELIINVFSSVILDILDSNYPRTKLITLGYANQPPMKFNKELVYIQLDQFNVEKDIPIESRY